MMYTMTKEEQDYADSIFKTLNELAEKAWGMGITINSVTLSNNLIRKGTRKGTVMYELKYPKIKKMETDYMTILIK